MVFINIKQLCVSFLKEQCHIISNGILLLMIFFVSLIKLYYQTLCHCFYFFYEREIRLRVPISLCGGPASAVC